MARGKHSMVAAFCGVGLAACGSGGSSSNESAARGTPDASVLFGSFADRAPSLPDAAPAEADASPFGANCGEEDECDSRCCVDFHCSSFCDPDDARACRDVSGLCAVVRNGRHACVGDVSATDGLVLHAGEHVTASLAGIRVVRLAVPRGSWRLVVTPAADLDLAVDFYDARALELGTEDEGVAGAPELVTWNATDELGAFAVVRHMGGVGGYELRLDPVQP
jgi:hypothetical protein